MNTLMYLFGESLGDDGGVDGIKRIPRFVCVKLVARGVDRISTLTLLACNKWDDAVLALRLNV